MATATEIAGAIEWLRVHGLTQASAVFIVEAMRHSLGCPDYAQQAGAYGQKALKEAFAAMAAEYRPKG